MVIDHMSYAVSETEGDHTLIASDDFIKSNVILGNEKIEASADSDTVNLGYIQLDLTQRCTCHQHLYLTHSSSLYTYFNEFSTDSFKFF